MGLLPWDSTISLESKKTPVSGKGVRAGRHRSIYDPSNLNESRNTKSPHYGHYCQITGNQLTDTGQMDIREESVEPELVLSPAELNLWNQRSKERQALCFYFPVFPYYLYMLFIPVASDRNLHKVRGPRMLQTAEHAFRWVFGTPPLPCAISPRPTADAPEPIHRESWWSSLTKSPRRCRSWKFFQKQKHILRALDTFAFVGPFLHRKKKVLNIIVYYSLLV